TLSNFIPPGLIFAMNFYVPRYRAKKNINKLRSFIFKGAYLRIFSIFVFTLIGFLIFFVFNSFFNIYLGNHPNLLYLLLPLIPILSFETFIATIFVGFNLFKFYTVTLVLKTITNLSPLLWFFYGGVTVQIEHLAIINLLTALFPLIFEILIIILKFPKRASESGERLTFKIFLKKVLKYGSFLRIQGLLGEIFVQSQTQAIGIYENPEWVTGNSVSKTYTATSGMFLNSLNGSLLYSFSSIDYKKEYESLTRVFNNILIYTIYIFLMISGILFLFSEFFLGLIFGDDYVQFSILIKLILIGNTISIYGSLYIILLRTTYRIKQQIILIIIAFPLQVIVFFIGIINFGLVGFLFLDIIHRAIWLVVFLVASIKIMKVNVKFLKVFSLYLTFFLSLFLSIILGDLFLNNISYQFWQLLNFILIDRLNFLTILIFLILFIGLNILIKTFTKKDLESIEFLFSKDTRSNRFIKRFLKFLKRFLR
ncbi:MAG: lipopolysaccharide biosynthesis protein, partial [Candidatus Heimdallarchaeota archaeon]